MKTYLKLASKIFFSPFAWLGLMLTFSINLSADTLYWVDATSYFNAPKDGKVGELYIWNIARKFNSTNQSEYSANYNWATGYSVNDVVDNEVTYKVPTYTYGDTPTAPSENTDVYFKYTDFSSGSSTVGYRYHIAGRIDLSADTTVKSISVENANDNWFMFYTNNHNLTVKEDFTVNSPSTVTRLSATSSDSITIGGTVNIKSGSTNIWHSLRVGSDTTACNLSFGAIKFFTNSRMQISTGASDASFDNAYSNVSGLTDFGAYASRLDLGTRTQSAEQFYKFNGISASNTGALISNSAENASTGIKSTIVFANASGVTTFAGKISNALVANDSGADGRALDNTTNVVMSGSGTQMLSGANDFRGYVQVESGTLLLKTADGAQHGKLTLNGGKFGAIGEVKVSSSEWNGGELCVFNTLDSVANMTPEKISIDGAFTKSGAGKIVFDFNNIDTLDLVDNDEWYDLIVASSLEGFLSDANDDFASVNLKNAYSVFKWLNDTAAGTSTLQVSFSSVPEPATYAAIFGVLALGIAAWRKRKQL